MFVGRDRKGRAEMAVTNFRCPFPIFHAPRELFSARRLFSLAIVTN
jgi:hypothetical protein